MDHPNGDTDEISRIATSAARPTPYEAALAATIAGVVALCGADRIDLAGGRAFVTLPPSLFLYVIAIALLVIGIRSKRLVITLDRYSAIGLISVAALAAIALVSIGIAGAPGQPLRRWVLLVLTIAGVWSVLLLARSANGLRWLRAGAWIGLGLAVLLSLIQLINWSPAQAGVPHWWGPIYLTSPTYGPIAPRPSGLSLDPNRGALVSAVLVYILAADPWTRLRKNPRLIWLALALSAVSALPTLSRSGLLVWGAVVLVALYRLIGEVGARRVLIPVGSGLALGLIGVGVVLSQSHTNLIALLQERLSFSSSDSGGQHIELVGMALTVLNDSWTRWITGVGFGNSTAFTSAYFGGRDVANFHSFFVTFLVEMGVLGMLVAVALAAYPLVRSGRRVFTLALIVFGLVYQAHLDGVFWLALGMLWLTPEPSGDQRVRRPRVRTP